MPDLPPVPERPPLDPAWRADHGSLYEHVQEALATPPFYFRTETTIAGINATDIFNLNAALGAAIEDQVVATLNAMRSEWDPEDAYALYGFVRQSQTFPDVLLRRLDAPNDVLMGIELKGWYLLSKEGEPSFCYAVTPAAWNRQDLVVVVPWALSNVIGGSPRTFAPYVESARYAAAFRNHHWQHVRNARAGTDRGIASPADVAPYPSKADRISDKPASDSGGNFGRFARTGIMDAFIGRALGETLSGIQARHWLAFFKAFQDQTTAEAADAALRRLESQIAGTAPADDARRDRTAALVEAIRNLFGDG